MKQAERLWQVYSQNLSKEGGFLPQRIPHIDLPPIFKDYTKALADLHLRYPKKEGVRTWLKLYFEKTPPLVLENLAKLPFWQQNKLLTVLTLLAHAFRWDSLPPTKERYEELRLTLPEGIRLPMNALCKIMDQPCCGSLWNTTICNWKIKGKPGGNSYKNEEISMENLEIAHSWFKDELHIQLEKWVLIFVVMEAKGAFILQDIVRLIQHCEDNAPTLVQEGLERIHKGILGMLHFFNQEVRYKKLDVNLWRLWIQPTFIWGLEDQNGDMLEGASGLQLGITQSLDLAFGIDNSSKIGKTLANSRRFMPTFHRSFLAELSKSQHTIRNYVNDVAREEIKAQFNACVDLILKFRQSHKARGAAYIKGDLTTKTMTSTGLSILAKDTDLVEDFEKLMDERIEDTSKVFV